VFAWPQLAPYMGYGGVKTMVANLPEGEVALGLDLNQLLSVAKRVNHPDAKAAANRLQELLERSPAGKELGQWALSFDLKGSGAFAWRTTVDPEACGAWLEKDLRAKKDGDLWVLDELGESWHVNVRGNKIWGGSDKDYALYGSTDFSWNSNETWQVVRSKLTENPVLVAFITKKAVPAAPVQGFEGAALQLSLEGDSLKVRAIVVFDEEKAAEAALKMVKEMSVTTQSGEYDLARSGHLIIAEARESDLLKNLETKVPWRDVRKMLDAIGSPEDLMRLIAPKATTAGKAGQPAPDSGASGDGKAGAKSDAKAAPPKPEETKSNVSDPKAGAAKGAP
jgi:hypothetical protein